MVRGCPGARVGGEAGAWEERAGRGEPEEEDQSGESREELGRLQRFQRSLNGTVNELVL